MKNHHIIILAALSVGLSATASAVAEPQRVGLHCQMPDSHHMIREVKPCPDGSGTQYEAWSAMSYSTYGRHLDWEPISYMSFPYPIAICENGFIVDRPEEEQDEAWIEARSALIEDDDYQALLGEQTSHFLYAYLLEMEGANPSSVSWHYLNSTWEADQCGMDSYDVSAREFLRVADEEFEGMSPSDESFAVYVILRSNLHRRIGEFETARQIFEDYMTEYGHETPEGLSLAFDLLDAAITARSSEQVAIQAPEE